MKHHDTPARRAEMIAATNGLADRYPAARLAVAVMESETGDVLWSQAVAVPRPTAAGPLSNLSPAEFFAQVLSDILLVATTERPDATLAKAAMAEMGTDDFKQFVTKRLLRTGAVSRS